MNKPSGIDIYVGGFKLTGDMNSLNSIFCGIAIIKKRLKMIAMVVREFSWMPSSLGFKTIEIFGC